MSEIDSSDGKEISGDEAEAEAKESEEEEEAAMQADRRQIKAVSTSGRPAMTGSFPTSLSVPPPPQHPTTHTPKTHIHPFPCPWQSLQSRSTFLSLFAP